MQSCTKSFVNYYAAARDSETAASCIDDVHLFVRLFVCLSVAKMQKTRFFSKTKQLRNSLPDDITSASSLPVFRKKLKTHLFQQSYPDIILLFAMVFCRHRGP